MVSLVILKLYLILMMKLFLFAQINSPQTGLYLLLFKMLLFSNTWLSVDFMTIKVVLNHLLSSFVVKLDFLGISKNIHRLEQPEASTTSVTRFVPVIQRPSSSSMVTFVPISRLAKWWIFTGNSTQIQRLLFWPQKPQGLWHTKKSCHSVRLIWN